MPPKPETTRGSASPRFGRRLATGIFWAATLYLTTAGFTSITAQVFFPETPEPPAGSECHAGVETLRADLLARAAEHTAAAGRSDPAALARWLDDWDRRNGALRSVCTGDGERAHAALTRLRHRTEDSLVRESRDLGPLDRTLERELSR